MSEEDLGRLRRELNEALALASNAESILYPAINMTSKEDGDDMYELVAAAHDSAGDLESNLNAAIWKIDDMLEEMRKKEEKEKEQESDKE